MSQSAPSDPRRSATGTNSLPSEQPVRRTPTVLQYAATECAAASLSMVLQFYGRYVPLETLRQECGVSRDGATTAGLRAGAEAEGLSFELHRTKASAAAGLPTPFVAYWNSNHYLVVEGRDRHGWHLNDPASGRRLVSDEEFSASYSKLAAVLAPGPEFVPKPDPRGAYFRSLWRPLRGTSAPLWLAMVIGLLLIVPQVLMPAIAAVFIDDVLVGGNSQWLGWIIAATVALGMLSAALRFLHGWVLLHLSMPLDAQLQGGFLWHLLRLPADFYSQRPVGGLQQRIHKSTEIAGLVIHGLPGVIVGTVTMVVIGVALVARSPLLALVAVMAALLSMVTLWLTARFRRAASEQIQANQFQLSGLSMRALSTMPSIKAQGAAGEFLATYMNTQATSITVGQRLARYTAYFGLIPATVKLFTSVALLTVGALEVMSGNLTVGVVIACLMLTSKFLAPISTFLGVGHTLQTTHATVEQINDVLETPLDAEYARPEGVDAGVTKLSGHVRLREVTFGYSPLRPPLLSEINLEIPAGSFVAFVGRSGSGKSTLAKLICGQAQPWSGKVEFDGVDRMELPRWLTLTSVALVQQGPFMYPTTVDDNVRVFDPTITPDKVAAALSDADATAFLATRGGASAVVAEGGGNLSGGQVQRLEIARGLVRDPAILILDEATSALDGQTEAELVVQLRERRCTTITIAHRLSTVREADVIYVLDRGRIVQSGRHDELLAEDGLYQRLMAGQQVS